MGTHTRTPRPPFPSLRVSLPLHCFVFPSTSSYRTLSPDHFCHSVGFAPARPTDFNSLISNQARAPRRPVDDPATGDASTLSRTDAAHTIHTDLQLVLPPWPSSPPPHRGVVTASDDMPP